MATTIENYFQPGWRDQQHTCPACEWKGSSRAMEMELDEDATEYDCPVCENPLLVVLHPDMAQVQAAAAEGNAEAQEQLDIIASFRARSDAAHDAGPTLADYDAGVLAASENPMVRLLSRWLPLLALLMMSGCTSLPDSARGRFEARAVKVDGHTAYYQVFIPAGLQARSPGGQTRATSNVPVILFLHGSGERGADGIKQTHAGLGPYLREHPDFPALVVFPQVPGHEEWSGRNNRAAVAALDATIAEFGADPARQYLTGMSMGGYGSWNIALDDPRRFAAIVPVCGAVLAPRAKRPTLFVEQVVQETDPYAVIAQRLQHTPIWIFHGALDDVVPPDDDRRLHAAFQSANARDVRYTEYPEGNHNAWDATYADPAMWAWLFAQKR